MQIIMPQHIAWHPTTPPSVLMKEAREEEIWLETAGAYANKQDYVAALAIYLALANQGSRKAVTSFELMIRTASAGKEALFDYCNNASKGEMAEATYALGMMYQHGCGVMENEAEAFSCFLKADELGVPEATNKVGVMYCYGCGIAQDDGQAFKFFTKANELGVPEATNNVGMMYYYGRGIEQDDGQAFKFFTKANELGVPMAQENLGDMYYHGRGVPQNIVKAREYYEEAKRLGVRSAGYKLKDIDTLDLGAVHDAPTEKAYCNASKELGVPQRTYLYNLGVRYLNGKNGDSQSHTKARQHLKAAYRLGHPGAAFHLAESYRTAGFLSGRQDDDEAIKWYSRAAAAGDKQAEAQRILTTHYSPEKHFYWETFWEIFFQKKTDINYPFSSDEGL